MAILLSKQEWQQCIIQNKCQQIPAAILNTETKTMLFPVIAHWLLDNYYHVVRDREDLSNTTMDLMDNNIIYASRSMVIMQNTWTSYKGGFPIMVSIRA